MSGDITISRELTWIEIIGELCDLGIIANYYSETVTWLKCHLLYPVLSDCHCQGHLSLTVFSALNCMYMN